MLPSIKVQERRSSDEEARCGEEVDCDLPDPSMGPVTRKLAASPLRLEECKAFHAE